VAVCVVLLPAAAAAAAAAAIEARQVAASFAELL